MIKGFKGFDKNLKCRDKQYEIGKEEIEDETDLCTKGMHFCEYPLDCFAYYPPTDSRYCEIEADDISDKTDIDSKRVCKKLKIGAEIGIKGMVEAAVKFTFNKADWSDVKTHHTGDQGAASATGYQGAASATGYQGAASATGTQGAASATGTLGAASATGTQGAASATGDLGAASATGYQGAASATGTQGAASATGTQGAASATGYQGAASATGYQGAASATGTLGAASATGKESVACGLGYNNMAKASKGNWIVLAERDDNYEILCIKTAKAGADIKPDVFYKLIGGKFVVEESE